MSGIAALVSSLYNIIPPFNAWGISNSSFYTGPTQTQDTAGNIYIVSVGRGLVYDISITKLNSSGVAQYSVKSTAVYSSNAGAPISIAATPTAIYISLNYDPTSAGTYSSTIIKFDATTGAFLWSRKYGTPSGYSTVNIAVDSSDNVYFAGGGVVNGTTNVTGYIAKVNSSGTIVWQKGYTDTGSWMGYVLGIAIDSSSNVFAYTSTKVIKILADGSAISWTRIITGDYFQYCNVGSTGNITVLANGGIFNSLDNAGNNLPAFSVTIDSLTYPSVTPYMLSYDTSLDTYTLVGVGTYNTRPTIFIYTASTSGTITLSQRVNSPTAGFSVMTSYYTIPAASKIYNSLVSMPGYVGSSYFILGFKSNLGLPTGVRPNISNNATVTNVSASASVAPGGYFAVDTGFSIGTVSLAVVTNPISLTMSTDATVVTTLIPAI